MITIPAESWGLITHILVYLWGLLLAGGMTEITSLCYLSTLAWIFPTISAVHFLAFALLANFLVQRMCPNRNRRPYELRICDKCDWHSVQDEEHILLDYPHKYLVSLRTQHRQLVFPPQYEDSPMRLRTLWTNQISMVWPLLWLCASPFSLDFCLRLFGLVTGLFQASAQMPPRGIYSDITLLLPFPFVTLWRPLPLALSFTRPAFAHRVGTTEFSAACSCSIDSSGKLAWDDTGKHSHIVDEVLTTGRFCLPDCTFGQHCNKSSSLSDQITVTAKYKTQHIYWLFNKLPFLVRRRPNYQ
jgi:hypothetical protein